MTIEDAALLEGGNLNQRPKGVIKFLYEWVRGFAGILVANPMGEVGIAFNTRRFARAFIVEGMDAPHVAVGRPTWNGREDEF